MCINNDIRKTYTLEQLEKCDKNLRMDSKRGLYHPPGLGAYEPHVGLVSLTDNKEIECERGEQEGPRGRRVRLLIRYLVPRMFVCVVLCLVD